MPKRSVAISQTIPPPVLGWNTRDPVSDMDPRYAVDTDNFISKGGTVDLRNGYRYHAKNIGAFVQTLVAFPQANGTSKLVAIGQGTPNTIYECGSGGGAPTDITGAVTIGSYALSTIFSGRLFLKDTIGGDVCVWDGVAAGFSYAAFTGPGGDDKLLTNISSYKGRLYFCGQNSLIAWYTATAGAVTGALSSFDFSTIFTLGGYLLYAGPATKYGVNNDQYFVAISSLGEVLLYQGDNPASQTWGLIGKFLMPPPLGFRSFIQWGANIAIITTQGVVLLSEVLNADADLSFLSDNISSAFVDTISTALSPDFATGIYYPRGNLIIFAIPSSATTPFFSLFIYSTLNKSWWKWSGISALQWAIFEKNLYFGGGDAGRVFRADYGDFDESQTSEGAVLTRTIKLRPAYNYFNNRELKKQFVEVKPIVYQSEGLSLAMKADIDYENVAAANPITETGDTSYKLYRPTMITNGVGYSASIRIDGTVETKRMSLQAIQVIFNEADIV